MSVRIGPRDMWAVQWLAEMYGAPMNVVAELLGTSETNAYRVVGRWRDAGLVSDDPMRPVPGPMWVVPTAAAASSLLGFTVQRWVPGPKDARHVTLTARARIALAGREIGEDSWSSERILRREANRKTPFGSSEPRAHLHDGHWTDDLGRLHAIEIELTRKGSADIRDTVSAAYAEAKKAGADSLIYYCATDEVRTRVQTTAQKTLRPVAGDPEFVVRPLDGLLNVKNNDQTGGGLAAVGGAA
ncbi:hypothetical protein [Nocardia cyriacigeorgica]|uniref:hypothetical protein n=1 Tax=Nocardia cyriacigeorgica TaxID=135487 RepID=UPI002457B8F4|nr:hypothetical protein [Nocardia cyriacigeorgica]